MTKEHLIANINIQKLSNLSKKIQTFNLTRRDNCKEEHIQIANTTQIQPEQISKLSFI